MSGIERGPGDYRVGVNQVLRGRDVEAGFIPEKREAQQRRVHQETDYEDHRKEASE